MYNPTRLGWIGFALIAALASGCLPSSCNRSEDRALFPADSTSRAIADGVRIDTLVILGIIVADDVLEMEYPRTVAFAPNGGLWISDTELNRVTGFNGDNEIVASIETEDFAYPYIAGFHGDTLLVFSPDSREIALIVGSERIGSIPIPGNAPERGAYQYAAASDDAVYFKAIGEDFEGYVLRLDTEGATTARWNLTGEYWRFAGLLRTWGESVLSLSGYRPVVHLMTSGETVDTLALSGFDSPMLARSRRFIMGDIDVPPLLTASAAGAGEFLFVLNMRPGWLRVDVYDRDGRLQRVLTQPWPEFNQEYYPTDIGAFQREDGSFEIAVTLIEPEARVERYLWKLEEGDIGRVQ